jgi:hypothetical protein
MSDNILREVVTGRTVKASEVNQYFSALTGSLVPRTNGAPVAGAHNLGSATYKWNISESLSYYFAPNESSMNIGQFGLGSNISIFSGTTPIMQFLSTQLFAIDNVFTHAKFDDRPISTARGGLSRGAFIDISSTTTPTTWADVPGLNVTLTVGNRPVLFFLEQEPDPATFVRNGYVSLTTNSNARSNSNRTSITLQFRLVDDTTEIDRFGLVQTAFYPVGETIDNDSTLQSCSIVRTVFMPPVTGARTYKIQVQSNTGSTSYRVRNVRCVAVEF